MLDGWHAYMHAICTASLFEPIKSKVYARYCSHLMLPTLVDYEIYYEHPPSLSTPLLLDHPKNTNLISTKKKFKKLKKLMRDIT